MSARSPRRRPWRPFGIALGTGVALVAAFVLIGSGDDEDRAAQDGDVPKVLARDGSEVGASLPDAVRGAGRRTTLDRRVQAAAVAALGRRGAPASVVVVDARVGDILAVASRPGAREHDPLGDLHPPGSTFKTISSHALLRAGLRPAERVPCAQTARVDQAVFRNLQVRSPMRPIRFAEVFARSCNTTFAVLAPRVSNGQLRASARLFGLGRRYRLPGASPARVGRAATPAEHAAAMIGRHRTLVSPLALAGVAATVADGRWHEPRLFPADPVRAGRPLARRDRFALGRMMRRVVTSGTGAALAGVPGWPAGKTGLVRTKADSLLSWFIGYRGPLAFAVLVETSGADHPAVRTAADFLRRLPNGYGRD